MRRRNINGRSRESLRTIITKLDEIIEDFTALVEQYGLDDEACTRAYSIGFNLNSMRELFLRQLHPAETNELNKQKECKT